jgi:hypothetical protein
LIVTHFRTCTRAHITHVAVVRAREFAATDDASGGKGKGVRCFTPLHRAAAYAHAHLVEFLLSRGDGDGARDGDVGGGDGGGGGGGGGGGAGSVLSAYFSDAVADGARHLPPQVRAAVVAAGCAYPFFSPFT